MSDFTIRHLEHLEELRAAVRLQKVVWGEDCVEIAPVTLLRSASHAGGLLAGAFDEAGELVGVLFGLAGWIDRRPVHWSDLMAVHPDWRGHGVGVALKLFQRKDLLARGVPVALWTFDPLESRNGHLNMSRLGCTAVQYFLDYYGTETASPLHAGIGTDRLVAEWDLDSERVKRRLAGEDPPPGREEMERAPLATPFRAEGGRPVPAEPDLALDAPRIRIAVPADIQALKAEAPEVAIAWRAATRAAFLHYLEGGWRALEVLRAPGGVGEYLLGR